MVRLRFEWSGYSRVVSKGISETHDPKGPAPTTALPLSAVTLLRCSSVPGAVHLHTSISIAGVDADTTPGSLTRVADGLTAGCVPAPLRPREGVAGSVGFKRVPAAGLVPMVPSGASA